MLSTVREYVRRRRFGEPIVIVSGLPRSGTSMMMRMIEAGGVQSVTDGLRTADVDNPKGYFELERIKDLEKETDKRYIAEARGKSLKVISFLLKDLPADNFYQVVFMRRDLDEVIQSQDKMIEHRQAEDPTVAETLKEAYRNHIVSVRRMVRAASHFAMAEVNYRQAILDPRGVATDVNAFLGNRFDVDRMVAAVDPALYRNRRE